MINVDISNIWGEFTLHDLLNLEREVFDAHKCLDEGTGAGSEHRGWLNLPVCTATPETERILAAAEKIRSESDICVVVGIGGSCTGSRAAVELLQGENRNLSRGKGDPQLLYAGASLSTRQWKELTELLAGKDFSVVVISKSGTTLEPAIAFRGLLGLLEETYGSEGAGGRVYAVTDPINGALRQMAQQQGWETFSIPRNVGGRYSVLTAAGLLPMAVAGIDILEVLAGAAEAKQCYDLRSYENPVWLYAGVRNLMQRRGKAVELLSYSEPGFRTFGNWWRHLFAESEGKEGKGLLPVPVERTADLHALGQLIQEGQRNLFETVLRFDGPADGLQIPSGAASSDGLSYLEGKTLEFVDEMAMQAVVEAHADGVVPVLVMDCGELSPRKVGELFFFMELSCAVSAYILGVNPFNQPGSALYRRNLLSLLGKPGYQS